MRDMYIRTYCTNRNILYMASILSIVYILHMLYVLYIPTVLKYVYLYMFMHAHIYMYMCICVTWYEEMMICKTEQVSVCVIYLYTYTSVNPCVYMHGGE